MYSTQKRDHIYAWVCDALPSALPNVTSRCRSASHDIILGCKEYLRVAHIEEVFAYMAVLGGLDTDQ